MGKIAWGKQWPTWYYSSETLTNHRQDSGHTQTKTSIELTGKMEYVIKDQHK